MSDDHIIDIAVHKLIREQMLAVENLTNQQLAEAIKQALKSGDFVRYVVSGSKNHMQGIEYIPFYEVTRVKQKLDRLERLAEEMGSVLTKVAQCRMVMCECKVHSVEAAIKWQQYLRKDI